MLCFIFLHCPLSGPVLIYIYISLLIISCIIEYVKNKRTLNLEHIWHVPLRKLCYLLAVNWNFKYEIIQSIVWQKNFFRSAIMTCWLCTILLIMQLLYLSNIICYIGMTLNILLHMKNNAKWNITFWKFLTAECCDYPESESIIPESHRITKLMNISNEINIRTFSLHNPEMNPPRVLVSGLSSGFFQWCTAHRIHQRSQQLAKRNRLLLGQTQRPVQLEKAIESLSKLNQIAEFSVYTCTLLV